MSNESLEELLERLDDEIPEGDMASSTDLRGLLKAIRMVNEKVENRT